MTRPEDDATDRERLAARRRQDFEDQQNEIMGNETGRRTRFLGGQGPRLARVEKERKERAFRDALERLMQDREYRRLHEDLGTRLSVAESATDGRIEAVSGQLASIDRILSELEGRAARGPDRQPVFRFADGRVVDAGGRELPAEIAEGIIWPPDAPDAETYFGARTQRRNLADALDQWQTYRTDTLGGIRDRFEDRDQPMTKEEMRDALERIQSSVPNASFDGRVDNPADAAPVAARPDFTLPPMQG